MKKYLTWTLVAATLSLGGCKSLQDYLSESEVTDSAPVLTVSQKTQSTEDKIQKTDVKKTDLKKVSYFAAPETEDKATPKDGADKKPGELSKETKEEDVKEDVVQPVRYKLKKVSDVQTENKKDSKDKSTQEPNWKEVRSGPHNVREVSVSETTPESKDLKEEDPTKARTGARTAAQKVSEEISTKTDAEKDKNEKVKKPTEIQPVSAKGSKLKPQKISEETVDAKKSPKDCDKKAPSQKDEVSEVIAESY